VQLPAFVLGEVVVDFQSQRGADTGEAVDEHADEGAIAKTAAGVPLN
jgi:hypothetical protein